ncbi:YczE/YyaS/YitT family protein [Sphingomonas xanthus]|uniref:Integral membrane protein n=1 Tax=Sphingomonas xanthus TaxID=2594473 RepID=A0A516IP63_9SPHN|nr:hypothetical protein [Sphingomonas xanthus]QDP18705.1 hypothetical protein FMM02_01260 [Sphingomonas xanthus]
MLVRRLVQLYFGLLLYGLSMALMIRGNVGLNPWDVLHQGLSGRVEASFGTIVIGVGILVMLLWVPLQQRPGLGTISNIFVIGIAADLFLALVPELSGLGLRWSVMAAGVFLCGIAGAAYIGAGFGPGPRDGLMTGLSARTGWPLRRVRTGIELAVLGSGWLLGGTAGLGTVLFALAIGPLVQAFLPVFTPAPTVRALACETC